MTSPNGARGPGGSRRTFLTAGAALLVGGCVGSRQLGAYAAFAPGQLTDYGSFAWAPIGGLHFAGDHTSHRPVFMHGAVSSAKRVLGEIAAGETERVSSAG